MSWESKARYLEELRTKGNNDYDKVVEEIANILYKGDTDFDREGGFTPEWDYALEQTDTVLSKVKINNIPLSELIKKYLAGELVEIIPFEARVLLDSLRGRIRLYIDFDEAALIAKLKPISEKGG